MSVPQVLFKPFPKQEEFLEKALNSTDYFCLFGGAIRGGKTFAGLGALIILCKMYPYSRWAIVRKDLPTLKRNTIPSFRKIVPSNFCLGGSMAKAYNQERQEVTFTNGSQIIFFPENYTQDKELDRWKGLEVNGFLFEEINECQEVSFDKAIERAGSWIMPEGVNQPPEKILATCNPTQNWVKTRLYDKALRGLLDKGWNYIQSRIFDNPFIPKSYIRGLKALPKEKYQVFVLGNWNIKLRSGAEFYHKFTLERNTSSRKYDRNLPLHISFDENVNPYLPATIWQADGLDVWQVDEIAFERPKNKLKDVCSEISRRYRFHVSGMYIYGDATSKKEDVKIEKGQDFFKLAMGYLRAFKPVKRVPKSNPSVVMRCNFINELMDGQIDFCSVSIYDKCTMSLADVSNVLQASDGKKLKLKEKDPKTGITFERWGHLSDSMDYFLIWYFKAQYREYQTGVSDKVERQVKRRILKRTY